MFKVMLDWPLNGPIIDLLFENSQENDLSEVEYFVSEEHSASTEHLKHSHFSTR